MLDLGCIPPVSELEEPSGGMLDACLVPADGSDVRPVNRWRDAHRSQWRGMIQHIKSS